MKRTFKGLWYMIWDQVGLILMALIMTPLYALDVVTFELITGANQIIAGMRTRSFILIIVTIIKTLIVSVIWVMTFFVEMLVQFVMAVISVAKNASKYASGKDEGYHWNWCRVWNYLQYFDLKIKKQTEAEDGSLINFE